MSGTETSRTSGRRAAVAAAVVTALMVASTGTAGASSHSYAESGDSSGDVLSPTVIGHAVTVTGQVASTTDVDAYEVCLGDQPLVAAATGGAYDADFGLYLFDAAGEGLLYNEDRAEGEIDPRLDETAFGVDFPSGRYVIAISSYNLVPLTASSTRIFDQTSDYTAQQAPMAPDLVVASWSDQGASATGTYSLSLTGTVSCDAPPPDDDADDDGVIDGVDRCPDSSIDDRATNLKANRYHTVGGVFVDANGQGTRTMVDTGGCSLTQIVDTMGLPESNKRNGISGRNLDEWISSVSTAG